MKFAGRLTVRPGGKGMLVMGAVIANDILQPGRVYELFDVLGEPLIKDIGPSAVKLSMQDYITENLPNPGVCWSNEAGHVLQCGGGAHLLTEEEYKFNCIAEQDY